MSFQDQAIDNGDLVPNDDRELCARESSETACYSDRDLISFGSYLLSDERKEKFSATENSGMLLEARLRLVWDADLANWKFQQTQKVTEVHSGKESISE